MTHLQFFPYHNKLIRFRCRGNSKWIYGVILDIIEYGQKKTSTHYSFIPIRLLDKWKLAFRNGNKTAMKRIEKDIDIKSIVNAEVINLKTKQPITKQPSRLQLLS